MYKVHTCIYNVCTCIYNVCTWYNHFYGRPDAAEAEEAIDTFISGLKSQEQAGFDRLHTLLSRLPVPVASNGSKMSHTAALDGGSLPKMDEEQQKMFTPCELLLYKHAVEYKYYIHVYIMHICG
jgi:hypothetical protein